MNHKMKIEQANSLAQPKSDIDYVEAEGPSQVNASLRAAQVYNNDANSSIQEARESPGNVKHRAFSGFNSRLGDDDVNESEESTDGESSVYDSSNDSLNFSDA